MSASEQFRTYRPFVGPYDPCPPIRVKSYNVPPQLFMNVQPPNLPQFSAYDALKYGTLWQPLYAPYPNPSAAVHNQNGGVQ